MPRDSVDDRDGKFIQRVPAAVQSVYFNAELRYLLSDAAHDDHYDVRPSKRAARYNPMDLMVCAAMARSIAKGYYGASLSAREIPFVHEGKFSQEILRKKSGMPSSNPMAAATGGSVSPGQRPDSAPVSRFSAEGKLVPLPCGAFDVEDANPSTEQDGRSDGGLSKLGAIWQKPELELSPAAPRGAWGAVDAAGTTAAVSRADVREILHRLSSAVIQLAHMNLSPKAYWAGSRQREQFMQPSRLFRRHENLQQGFLHRNGNMAF